MSQRDMMQSHKINTFILTKEMVLVMDGTDIRLRKMIQFFRRHSNVYVIYPAKRQERSEKEGATFLGFKNITNIRGLRRIMQGLAIRSFTKNLSESITPDIIYTQSPIMTSVFRDYPSSIKIFDVPGLNESENLKGKGSFVGLVKSKYYGALEKAGLNYADYVFTVNKAHKKAIERITRKKVFVIRDGIDRELLKGSAIKPNSKQLTLVYVGTLIKIRIKDAILAMPSIAKEQNVKLHIIGDGPDLKYYERLAEDLNCAERITFHGYIERSRAGRIIRQADICFSDDWSYIGFPMKVFDYMAMGKPSLVEDTPAVREIIKDGLNGLLYKNRKDFARKVIMLAKDRRMREKIGRRALEDVRKHHTWETRRREFDAILRRILQNER